MRPSGRGGNWGGRDTTWSLMRSRGETRPARCGRSD